MRNQHNHQLLLSILLLGALMLACRTEVATPDSVIMLTRLPTLTPTPAADGGAAPSETGQSNPNDAPPTNQQGANDNNQNNNNNNPNDAPVNNNDAPDPLSEEDLTLSPDSSSVILVNIDREREFTEIANVGETSQDLTGWNILSEKGSQRCNLAGVLDPGETLRIWAMAADASNGGYNCGFSQEIWDDSGGDTAILFDAARDEVSRLE